MLFFGSFCSNINMKGLTEEGLGRKSGFANLFSLPVLMNDFFLQAFEIFSKLFL